MIHPHVHGGHCHSHSRVTSEGSYRGLVDAVDDDSEASGETVTEDSTPARLGVFGSLNLCYVLLQLWSSVRFSSLALLSDAFHNLSDVAAIGMAAFIHNLQHKGGKEGDMVGSDKLPYGYKRAEVVGGLVNSVSLVALSCYVVLNAIPRLLIPMELEVGWGYVGLAFTGVIVNLVGVLFFLGAGDDPHDHLHHGGGFLHAHSHGHSHG
ncbi:unnamed protein product [Discosporangium mesarthrocarpum]